MEKGKFRLKFQGNLVKKDFQTHVDNIKKNKPIMNKDQFNGFTLYLYYYFLPFFAGVVCIGYSTLLGMLILLFSILFKLEVIYDKTQPTKERKR